MKKRFTEEQIIGFLAGSEVQLSFGWQLSGISERRLVAD